MGFIVTPFVFLFVTVPSIVYSISVWIFLPIGLLLRLFTGRSFAIRTFPLVLYKLILPIFLILGVPLILYFYVWGPLGWIFSAWMIIYFISRRFSGVHEWQVRYLEGLKELDDLEQEIKRKQ
jgi:hypothetical protein